VERHLRGKKYYLKKNPKKLSMKNIRIRIFPMWILILLPLFSLSDPGDWKLKKNENGIEVYTRYAENSPLKEVRVVTVVQSSLSAIVALLLDVKNYPNWIYSCSEASTLNVINDHDEYHYQVTHLPWPLSNRDLIWHFKIEQEETTKIVAVTNTSEPDYIPAKKGIVRVKHVQSGYRLTPLANGKIKVEFEIFVDPGGNIPAWLVNANIVSAPYKTTVGMIKQLPNYQKASVPFIFEK
jgi:ribosome-associated toxin RatA of RatAB toxin-antitoxin module